MNRLRGLSIHDAYALIALFFGLIIVAITPPFGAGDETAHFERAYEVATGAFLGAEGLPAGAQAFIDDAFGKVKAEGTFNAEDYERWAQIPLDRQTIEPYPEPIRIVLRLHNPLCYAHMAPLMAIGLQFQLPPIVLFYLCRFAALFAGVLLVRRAIAETPFFKLQFAGVALLPTAMIFFAAANVESLLIGLCFYYIAKVFALTSDARSPIARKDILALALAALLIHQFKTAYFLVPALALLIPASRFQSTRHRLSSLALIFAPGLLINLIWVALVRTYMIDGLVYSTIAGGNIVAPAEQLRSILAAPVDFLLVLLRTITSPSFIAWTIQSYFGIGGWTNIAMPVWGYIAVEIGLALVFLSGPAAPRPIGAPHAVAFQSVVFLATFLGVLSLLYLQWTGVGAPRVEGFQGRYLISITPLLFAAAPWRFTMLASPAVRGAIFAAGSMAGLAAMTGAVAAQYYR